jgi:A/G-specific adenine glycosylase
MEDVRRFQEEVYDHYRSHGRELPWRETDDPYAILVSEMMLQQTQVPRVLEKYGLFLDRFPNVTALARAQLGDILRVWQGLGYNRRALALKRIAESVVAEHGGRVPQKEEALVALPGIGTATASAIRAFAFGEPIAFIETNIRAALIHRFFPDGRAVKDAELLPLAAETLDRENPRRWYYALMDYGAAAKKRHSNPGRRSAHYRRQSPFEGSNRQIRGLILRLLARERRMNRRRLLAAVDREREAVERNLRQLEKEGFIVLEGRDIALR